MEETIISVEFSRYDNESQIKDKDIPIEVAYISGCKLEGATWSAKEGRLMELSPRLPQSCCPIISVTAAHSRCICKFSCKTVTPFIFAGLLKFDIWRFLQFYRAKGILDVSLSTVHMHIDEWPPRACHLHPHSYWRWARQQMGVARSQTHLYPVKLNSIIKADSHGTQLRSKSAKSTFTQNNENHQPLGTTPNYSAYK
jgi:hypothetical protein